MFTVVFHHQYYSTTDHGHRVYLSEDSYLEEYPSQYTFVSEFSTEEEAQQFCSEQPFADEGLL